MSGSSNEEQDALNISPKSKHPRRRSIIESDDDDDVPTTRQSPRLTARKRHIRESKRVSGSSDQSADSSDSEEERRTPKRRVASKRQRAVTSSAVKSMFKGDRETAAEKFLESNEYGESDGSFINDEEVEDGEEDEDSPSSDDTIRQEDTNEDSDEVVEVPKPSLGSAENRDEVKATDDEAVSPVKKWKSQNTIESDESDCKEKGSSNRSSSSSPEVIKEKKRKRRKKLKRVKLLPDSQDADNQQSDDSSKDIIQLGIDSSSEDSDASGFIVSDSDSISGEDGATPLFYPEIIENTAKDRRMDPEQAFKVVLESMITRACNEDFFTSADFRENKGITTAFGKVFDPLDTLEKDMKSQAWCKPFVEALEYTKLSSTHSGSRNHNICQACNRAERYATYDVTMSGHQYNRRTLKPKPLSDMETEEGDVSDPDSLPELKLQFHIGVYCEERCQLYHDIRHFKFFLLQSCIQKVERHANKTTKRIVKELIVKDTQLLTLEFMHYNAIMRKGRELIRRRSKAEGW